MKARSAPHRRDDRGDLRGRRRAGDDDAPRERCPAGGRGHHLARRDPPSHGRPTALGSRRRARLRDSREGRDRLQRRPRETARLGWALMSPRTRRSTTGQTSGARASAKVVRGYRSSAIFAPQEARRAGRVHAASRSVYGSTVSARPARTSSDRRGGEPGADERLVHAVAGERVDEPAASPTRSARPRAGTNPARRSGSRWPRTLSSCSPSIRADRRARRGARVAAGPPTPSRRRRR